MGTFEPELGLDLKFFSKKAIGGGLLINEMKIEDLMGLLQEERRKIEAFKRELPFTLIIVDDVIAELRLEAEQCRSGECVIEELILLRTESNNNEEDPKVATIKKEKMDWMSSVRLCNDYSSDYSKNGDAMCMEPKRRSSGVENSVLLKEKEKHGISSQALSLATSAPCSSDGSACLDLQTQKKARRCWSPELHRRFVLALRQLGGAQAATPKQIRELMKVNGLTTDEVKSHLQKYRMHTKRTSGYFTQSMMPGAVEGGLKMAGALRNLSAAADQDSCNQDLKSFCWK